MILRRDRDTREVDQELFDWAISIKGVSEVGSYANGKSYNDENGQLIAQQVNGKYFVKVKP